MQHDPTTPSPTLGLARLALLALLLPACGGDGAGSTKKDAAADSAAGATEAADSTDMADATNTGAAQPGLGGPAQAPAATPDTVVAKIGDAEITQADVDARIAQVVASQMGQTPPQQAIVQYRSMLGEQALESLVDEHLLDAEVAALDLQLEDADYKTDYQHEIDIYLALEEMSQDDFEARVVEAEGTTYDEYVAKLSSDPDFRRAMRHVRVLREKYPAELEVTDEEIAARYEAEKEEQWTRPTSLRASHILFKVPDAAADPEGAAAARAEAERVLELAKAEDADFAALAREHSEGPSGPQGGDLGFFPRTGAMVEPFAAAAYDLSEGEVSDLVETQFGLHIIKATERKEGRVIPLEDVRLVVERFLLNEKMTTVREQLLGELRDKATIERL